MLPLLLLTPGLGGAAPSPAERQAFEAATRKYLRACVIGLETRRVDAATAGPPAGWEGRSCAQLVPELPDFNRERPTIAGSRVELRPETVEGYAVTVT